MREILYIQAGNLANYIGAHFWNTQEEYFTYGQDDEPWVYHDVSFREGISPKGEPTYCPRLLLFDRKANFGALSSGLYGEDDEGSTEASLWNGGIVEYRQTRIQKTRLQERVDEDDYDGHPDKSQEENVRYWSDYNRVEYLPRSIQKLPDNAEWAQKEGDWNDGKETFSLYDQDMELMEDSFRLFAEECDELQGIQLMNNTETFGSFTDSFLLSYRDEFAKLPCLAFPLMSGVLPGRVDVDDSLGIRKVINDALCLRSLDELSTLSIPIQSPKLWSLGAWSEGLSLNTRKMYHNSAILSAHIESATLPLRMKEGDTDLSSFCVELTLRANIRFANLGGVLPYNGLVTSSKTLDQRMFDFSTALDYSSQSSASLFARRDVTRGLQLSDIAAYDKWKEGSNIPMILYSSVHAPAYPLSPSYPSLFSSFSTPQPAHFHLQSHQTSLLSSIFATSHTSHLFSAYASFLDDGIKRKVDFENILGMDIDDMRGLASDLWTLHDNCNVGEGAEDDIGDEGMEEDD
ncbi:hypothetical protein JAAARDRAFT_182189 [Jaapia argillacea MUCL 33604]|uniref:Tubulin nucleotide-binding domain-like protein n=1 Tax=Jaapia argillacea MUCL 33604 TaxID=933084 RepID=A0A067PIF1_9AGAM|nr:hypothetical protein JAAARDRAFT_182189 [Jaapia argillacea MUCL 33604]